VKDLEEKRKLYEDLRKLAMKHKVSLITAMQPKPPKRLFTRLPKPQTGDLFTLDHIDVIFTKAKK
jgi:hypothetical protein